MTKTLLLKHAKKLRQHLLIYVRTYTVTLTRLHGCKYNCEYLCLNVHITLKYENNPYCSAVMAGMEFQVDLFSYQQQSNNAILLVVFTHSHTHSLTYLLLTDCKFLDVVCDFTY